MTKHQSLRARILRALRACDGVPMPEDALSGAVTPYVFGADESDVREVVRQLIAQDFVVSDTDAATQIKSFTLTTKGNLAAKQL
jgi:hypothetical protein